MIASDRMRSHRFGNYGTITDDQCSKLSTVLGPSQLSGICPNATSILTDDTAPDDVCTAMAGILSNDQLASLACGGSASSGGSTSTSTSSGSGFWDSLTSITQDISRALNPHPAVVAKGPKTSSIWVPLVLVTAGLGTVFVVVSNRKKRRY